MTLRIKAPTAEEFEGIVRTKHDFNTAAIRAALRVFVASQSGLKLWDFVSTRGRRRSKSASLLHSPNFRISLSLSGILLLHRLLYRFFSLLRENLLTKDARPFRRRNPRVSKLLISRLAPAIGASAAGFMLGVFPRNQLRVTVTIYGFTRALEFMYNKFDNELWFKRVPWWFGSWLIMPVSCGQLLHAFVFDRDCFPKAYGDFILNHTPNYVQKRPDDYPSHLAWPQTYEIVDGLATMAKLNYPPFVSPILFPDSKTLPNALSAIAPVVDPAHPAIKSLSCALLHPGDPSCLRTYITFFIQAFPRLARFFALVFAVFSLPNYQAFLKAPFAATNKLASSVLRMTAFITGAIGTSWGMICLFQQIFSRNLLPTQRFFLGGFIGGLWAFLERRSGRGQFLYTARMSIDSAWKVAVKRGWVRGVRDGDVWLFVASLAAINVVFDVDPAAVTSGIMRRGLEGLRGDSATIKSRTVRDAEADKGKKCRD
ncbi:MAG: hypothetical protein M1825_001210 [Sarcosagium campestre]|nr:MAG: hypothetical protein M1825_001210 [Sarcosagium campestre]